MEGVLMRHPRKYGCPACGAGIQLRRGEDHVDVCPECGEWLSEKGWPSRRLVMIDEEVPGPEFDETEEWEQTLVDELR